MLLPGVGAEHRVAVLVDSVDEVLAGDAEEWLSFFMPGGSPRLRLVVSDSISIPSAEIKRIAGDSHEGSPAAGLLLSSLDVGDAAPSTQSMRFVSLGLPTRPNVTRKFPVLLMCRELGRHWLPTVGRPSGVWCRGFVETP